MGNTSSRECLGIGCLAVGVALLSVAIAATTGEWLTALGLWGAILFLCIGLVFIGEYLRRRTTDTSNLGRWDV